MAKKDAKLLAFWLCIFVLNTRATCCSKTVPSSIPFRNTFVLSKEILNFLSNSLFWKISANRVSRLRLTVPQASRKEKNAVVLPESEDSDERKEEKEEEELEKKERKIATSKAAGELGTSTGR